MKTFMKTFANLAVLLGLSALAVVPVRAQTLPTITLSIDNATSQTIAAGSATPLEFTGLITNTGLDTVILSSDLPTVTSPNGTIDDTPFALNGLLPGVTLTAGDAVDLPLFDITPGAAVPGDMVTGTFDVQAVDSNANVADSGAQYFSVAVTGNASPAVPEPGPMALLGLGLLPLGALVARRRGCWG